MCPTAYMCNMRNAYKALIRKLEGVGHLGDLGTDKMAALNLILKNWVKNV
jgi:hypothetical protein